MTNLSTSLLDEIQSGNVVLFLGAGASLGAVNPGGQHLPGTADLGRSIADKFLGPKFVDYPIGRIAELASSEKDLSSVQHFIKEQLEGFSPTIGHLTLPKIPWKGLATTNYDTLIEAAYSQCPTRIQHLQPFVGNGDRIDDRMRDPRSLMLLKLHGCITRISNTDCPLILSVDQYVTHKKGRTRLFKNLQDWGFEHTFIFAGHSLQDPDIRAILLELEELTPTRPRHYLVIPNSDPVEERFWEGKSISIIPAKFDDFMTAVDAQVSPALRGLSTVRIKGQYAISEKFAQANVLLTQNCQQFVENDVEYVKGITATEQIDAKDFYRGFSQGWSAIERKLDVRRQLGDTILSDVFLINEADHPRGLEVILVKAYAGAGKSIFLRRTAWDASKDYDKLCIFLKSSSVINPAAIIELATYCKERIYLFIDDLGTHVRNLNSLSKAVEKAGVCITVVAAERVNEWNVLALSHTAIITEEYDLKYLQEKEIAELVRLLTLHQSLGTLRDKSHDEQMFAFRERAGRQLLVSLHEATRGLPFEDIVRDEYDNIVPNKAQQIYLTVCILNRLNVSVRAGLISRLHGVHLTEFKRDFFGPLEHVVYTIPDSISRDLVYIARHPLIADIVFHKVLTQQEERFEKIFSVLGALNIDYSSDRTAFRSILRGRSMVDLFPTSDFAERIFAAAYQLAPKDAFVFHQHALFYMVKGEYDHAAELLAEAMRLRPNDSTIQHSRAELFLKLAEKSRTELEKEHFLREAATLAKDLRRTSRAESHSHHTLIKIGLCRLRDLIDNQVTDNVVISDLIRNIEKELSEGLLEFPNDSYLLTAESDFARLLENEELMMSSLKKAFDSSPKNAFLAIRLANQHRNKNEVAEGLAILEKALSANPNDARLHYAFAKYILQVRPEDSSALEYHLQRSFVSGDKSFDAQLLYGRQLYINGHFEDSRTLFKRLRTAKVPYTYKSALSYPLPQRFHGIVNRIEASYISIRIDGGDTVSAQRSDIGDPVWKMLNLGFRINFKIGFNFHGPSATDIQVEDLF